MKRTGLILLPLILLGGGALLNSQTPPHSPGQSATPQKTTVVSQTQISQLITEIGAQQAELAKNQKAIKERLDKLEETLRQARIWAARRSGGGGRTDGANPNNEPERR